MSPRSTSTRPYFLEVIVSKDLTFKGRSRNREFSNNQCVDSIGLRHDLQYETRVVNTILLGGFFHLHDGIFGVDDCYYKLGGSTNLVP